MDTHSLRTAFQGCELLNLYVSLVHDNSRLTAYTFTSDTESVSVLTRVSVNHTLLCFSTSFTVIIWIRAAERWNKVVQVWSDGSWITELFLYSTVHLYLIQSVVCVCVCGYRQLLPWRTVAVLWSVCPRAVNHSWLISRAGFVFPATASVAHVRVWHKSHANELICIWCCTNQFYWLFWNDLPVFIVSRLMANKLNQSSHDSWLSV